MNATHKAAPVEEKFLTPGVMVMLAFMAIGLAFAIGRFLFGIGAVSNLNNQYPWGIWIAIDVASGVALAAGGFSTGLIAYVFNRNEYHAVIRPALLTAMLGYTFVVLGLLVDIGRYWNITSPVFNHNGNSVLFEVAICVMIYLHVLYIEFIPIVVERFKGRVDLPGPLAWLNGNCPLLPASVQPRISHAHRPIEGPSSVVHTHPAASVSSFCVCCWVSNGRL